MPIDPLVLAVFVAVYLGMLIGRVPGLGLDRAAIALCGAIALVCAGRLTPDQAWQAVDARTLALLFGLMVLSAQLRLGGAYTRVTRQVVARGFGPPALLALLVAVAGGLSAVLANDIVCLAMAPILVDACVRRGLDPVPFLLALAAAANVGSAATLIGNPQNMLIGQRLQLSFAAYLFDAALPAALGLLWVWAVVGLCYRGRWQRPLPPPTALPADRPFDRAQTAKGTAALLLLVAAFLTTSVGREVWTLGVAGVLLASRRLRSAQLLELVDWQLCVLFVGLFVVHAALARSGMVDGALRGLRDAGVDLRQPAVLFAAVAVASNVVSNVPAVMLLLPAATDHPQAGAALALASTLAGNLVLVGSIANLIVVEQAVRLGIAPARSGWWRAHLRVGVPITLGTLALAGAWLAWRAPPA